MHDCQHCLANGDIGQPRLKLYDDKFTHQVICKKCGSKGPEKQYSVDAVKEWAKFQSYDNKKAPE